MAQNQQNAEQSQNQQQQQQRSAAMASLMQQPQYKPLVKAEQLNAHNFGSFLQPAEIERYRQGVQGFWLTLVTENRESERHQAALQRLTDLSKRLFSRLHNKNGQSGQNQNGQQPPPNASLNQQSQTSSTNVPSGPQQSAPTPPKPPIQQAPQQQQQQQQQAQQQQQKQAPQQDTQQTQQTQNTQAQRQQQPASTQPPEQALIEECRKEAAGLDWVGPSHLTPGSEQARKWIAAAQHNYAKGSMTARMATRQLSALQAWAQSRIKAGEDRDTIQKQFQAQMEPIKKQHTEGKKMMTDVAQQGVRGGTKGRPDAGQAQTQQQQPQNGQQFQGNGNQQQSEGNRQQPLGQPPMMQRPAQGATQGVNQGVNPNNPHQAPQIAPNQQQPRPLPGPVQSQQQRPSNQQNGPNDAPKYDLDQAMQARAQSYTAAPQGNRQTSQNNTNVRSSTGEFSTKPQTNHAPPYVPPAPQAVGMPRSRPTLSGANGGPIGPMGQPAIQKPDTFLLQGPGDRVLDRKKLDELARQIMGADAADGDLLTPEVAESALQLADEFIENVVTNACKLAKLRGATTLEIRDIQLVLERQYNIRVPGFATDEVRAVRKTQPAAAYYQKMQAVQAAKALGGKPDT